MPNTTIAFGVALIIQGLTGYFASGKTSKTALIPAIPGGLLAVLGAIAHRVAARRIAMHGALAVGLVGSVVAFAGPRRKGPANPKASAARVAMSATCITYVALSTRAYIAGRCAEARHQSPESIVE